MRHLPSRRLTIAIALLLLVSGCSASPPTVPAAPALPSPTPPRTLTIYNWDTYIDPQILQDFERAHSVQIDYLTFGSNEEMLERVLRGDHSIDLVVPADYSVTQMRHENLLAPLPKAQIPNLRHLEPAFRNPSFDPGNRYCAPYLWGTVGIGYNRSAGAPPTGWKEFFDPTNPQRIAMLDEPRIALGVALLALGYSPNTTSSRELDEAVALLKRSAGRIQGYLPDIGQEVLAAREADMVLEFNGDILQLMREDPAIGYLIPREGSIIWSDSMCILASSANQDLAAQFINYVLDPQVGAMLASYVRYSTPNRDALPYLAEAERQNPALYPPAELRRRLFYLVDVNPRAAERYKAAWRQVRLHHANVASASLIRKSIDDDPAP